MAKREVTMNLADMASVKAAVLAAYEQGLEDARGQTLQRFAGLADELAAVADCIRRAAEETGQ